MEKQPVRTCAGLEPGDAIEAHSDGIHRFSGLVTEVQAELELVWAVDAIGHRRIVDLGSFDVYRLGLPPPDLAPRPFPPAAAADSRRPA